MAAGGGVAGVRPAVWAVSALCLVGGGVLVWTLGTRSTASFDAGSAPAAVPAGGAVDASPERSRESAAAQGAARVSAASGASRNAPNTAAATRDASGPRPAAPGGANLRSPGFRGAAGRTPGDAPEGRRPAERGAGPGIVPTGLGAGEAVDPGLEGEVAELGEKLGLVEPNAPGDAELDAGDLGAAQRAAADAVIAEYLLRQELTERFGGKILPYNYPIERLRQEIAQQVADLPDADRQGLLVEVATYLPENAAPLVMSHPDTGNVYEGPDAEYDPQGVFIYHPPRVFKR